MASPFRVSGWIAELDDATRAFANDRRVGYQYRAVRLIAPRLGEALHRRGGGVPAAVRF
jgi:hypothetical protein